MDTVKQAIQVIKTGLALLDEKDQDGLKYGEFSSDQVAGNAAGMINKHTGKEALLKVWAINEAGRIAKFVWAKGLMTSELEKAYRELPSVDEASEDYVKYSTERKAIADELEAQRRTYANEDKDMQIFQAILSGMNKEQAEKELEAYQKQVQQAMGK